MLQTRGASFKAKPRGFGFLPFFRLCHILIFRQRVLGPAKVGENVLPVDGAGLIRSKKRCDRSDLCDLDKALLRDHLKIPFHFDGAVSDTVLDQIGRHIEW